MRRIFIGILLIGSTSTRRRGAPHTYITYVRDERSTPRISKGFGRDRSQKTQNSSGTPLKPKQPCAKHFLWVEKVK